VVFDTYFLRTRHYFAEMFYPDRVRPRAVWLYNHILRRRGPFLKFIFFNVYNNSKNTFTSTFYDTVVARFVCIRDVSYSHRFIYSLLDAVPPIHAESSHVATDKVPSM